MTTATAPAEVELPPGYYVEPKTGAWLSLPWPPPDDLLTIGPQIAAWCEDWLRHHLTGEPWRFTRGQLRFLHWWYALDGPGPNARWKFRSGVKRGAKGTGKDPFLGALANACLCGPVRPVWDDEAQRWVGAPWHMSLVQIGANSEAQASDVLRVANAMVNAEMADEFGYDKGITRTQLASGSRLELLTSSEASSEGDPATDILLNETHHMTRTNGGQALAGVARRNVGKSPGGLARVLEATNSHQPGEDSVAEDSFEAWQKQASGEAISRDILYDSREAPTDLRLTVDAELKRGIAAAYADSPWTDKARIRDEALDPRTPVADSIRYYFNSLPTAEDAWIDPRKFDSMRDKQGIADGEAVALFLDCSKSTDATALSACRISDGYVLGIKGWQRPHGDRGKGWLAPREEVDARVRECFEMWDVQWFGVDPSPARDDEDESLYWADLIDVWHRDFRDEVLIWATPGQKNGSAVSFDMRLSQTGGRDRVRQFTEEAELTAAAIDDDAEENLSWDGPNMMRVHVHNARRRPNQFGVSIGKQTRSSSNLVDFAVTTVGARLGRRLVLNSGKARRRKATGRAMII